MTAAVLAGWQVRGICYGGDPELWFSTDQGEIEAAQAVCRRCPVKDECHEWAVGSGQESGVWGGVLFQPPPPPPLSESRTCADCRTEFAPVKAKQTRCGGCAKLRPGKPRVVCELCGRPVRVRWGRAAYHLPPGGKQGDEWCRLSGARRDPAE